MTSTLTRTNGSAMPTALSGAIVETLDLGGRYAGWVATVRINPSMRVVDVLSTGDTAKIREAMAGLILEWNFVDDEGRGWPLPKDGLDWDGLQFGVEARLYTRYAEALSAFLAVPKDTSTPSEPGPPSGT